MNEGDRLGMGIIQVDINLAFTHLKRRYQGWLKPRLNGWRGDCWEGVDDDEGDGYRDA